MITKQDLSRCWTIAGEANSLRRRIERLESSAQYSSAQIKDMPKKTTRSDKLGAKVVKLIGLKDNLVERVCELEELCQHIDAWAGEHLTATQALIVRLRYVDHLPWWLVAQKANYCKRQCYRIHGVILEKIT